VLGRFLRIEEMSNNKQSSVEKMFQEMIEIQQSGMKLTFDENLALLEKYKEMHKKEILNSYMKTLPIEYGVFTAIDKAHEYYKETFGGNNEQ
jgi:hypothetical protein